MKKKIKDLTPQEKQKYAKEINKQKQYLMMESLGQYVIYLQKLVEELPNKEIEVEE